MAFNQTHIIPIDKGYNHGITGACTLAFSLSIRTKVSVSRCCTMPAASSCGAKRDQKSWAQQMEKEKKIGKVLLIMWEYGENMMRNIAFLLFGAVRMGPNIAWMHWNIFEWNYLNLGRSVIYWGPDNQQRLSCQQVPKPKYQPPTLVVPNHIFSFIKSSINTLVEYWINSFCFPILSHVGRTSWPSNATPAS